MGWIEEVGNKPHNISDQIEKVGEDISVIIRGSGPHLGAIALGTPYISENSKETANSSVISVYGHKDGILCEKIAIKLAKNLRRRVAVLGGIHIENATPDDIEVIMGNTEVLIARVVERFEDV